MKALEGIRVVDLTEAMAAPFCSMNLGTSRGRAQSKPWAYP